MEKIRSGIAENLGHYVDIMCEVVISVALSFIYGWKLALAIVFYIPLTLFVNSAVAHVSLSGKLLESIVVRNHRYFSANTFTLR